ncbi:MAG TPA: NADH-quinone oxidoreductase subunit M [Symbiobacteriaceae bacterium]|nr:NADH-quinone oxidoreductase subunit M [Symbiobacteriaceae bacterium]
MLLSLIVFAPLVFALAMLFIPKTQEKLLYYVAGIGTLVPLVAGLLVAAGWASAPVGADAHVAGMKFWVDIPWIREIGVNFTMGVDGFAFTMILLSVILFPLALLSSYKYINTRVKDYLILFLILETGTNGVFVALDFMLFYVFWEIVLLPMYFLIGIWGGARREYAAIKFFLYTLIGSVVMLVGAIYLYIVTGVGDFNLLVMAEKTKGLPINALTTFAFFALVVGFAVKVPMWPFHTWLPDAHVEAPTPISMLLAGILLKLGSYAMVRISHPMLPQVAAEYAGVLFVLGVIGIVYAAAAAMAQTDFKKQVAYSSVNHMGFFVIALAAASVLAQRGQTDMAAIALAGGYFVTISHGLISPLFFFAVGMFYERTHTRDLNKLGGMFRTIPVISFMTAFIAFANLGLPGLAGFIGEFIALTGTYPAYGLWVLLAGAGLVITAAWHLLTMRNVLLGEGKKEYHGLHDVTAKEKIIFAPLAVLIVLFGVWPAPVLNALSESVATLSGLLGGK